MGNRTNAAVIEVSEDRFAADVLERSKSVPVVVDFWAPWCGPCRTLGPILEDLAERSGGSWVLAKVNADEAPALAREHRVMGIPAVKAFVDGRVADEFVGALPRYQVEAFLRTFLDTASSERSLRAAREALRSGDPDAARKAFAAIAKDSPHAEDVRTIVEALDRASSPEPPPGGAEAPTAPARYDRAGSLLARGDLAGALAELLEIVRLDRSFGDDAGRRTLVALFTLLGDEDPLTREYRGKLGSVLF